jgi:hypothetical protein
MLIYRGGHHVTKGCYWAAKYGAWIDGSREPVLPGGHDTVYLRICPGMLFLLAPIVGLAYFLALPMIALVFAGIGIGRKIGRGVAGTVGYFGWRPGEAYLGGRQARERGRDKDDRAGV